MELSGEKALERSTNVKSSLTQLPNYYSHKRRNQREVQRETRIERCRTKLASIWTGTRRFGGINGDFLPPEMYELPFRLSNFSHAKAIQPG